VKVEIERLYQLWYFSDQKILFEQEHTLFKNKYGSSFHDVYEILKGKTPFEEKYGMSFKDAGDFISGRKIQ
jgi:hypothetical protein